MTTIFDEESEEQSDARFEAETGEVIGSIEPIEAEGEVLLPPEDEVSAEDAFPLESLVTVDLCGLLFSIPGTIRARQTGHKWWELDQEEKTLIGTATQPLMVYLVRRYLGEGVGIYAASMAAISAIYLPRQMREVQESAVTRRRSPIVVPPPSTAESQPLSESEDAGSHANNEDWGIPFRE